MVVSHGQEHVRILGDNDKLQRCVGVRVDACEPRPRQAIPNDYVLAGYACGKHLAVFLEPDALYGFGLFDTICVGGCLSIEIPENYKAVASDPDLFFVRRQGECVQARGHFNPNRFSSGSMLLPYSYNASDFSVFELVACGRHD
jgi:hypothetical protein